jgi:hypothetical protein
MLKNYLITAWSSLWKRKFFSLINVLGLSIGISASLVIYLIVNYEFSYDSFEPDRSRMLMVKDSIPLTVTGVVKDLQQVTDFNFGVFISRAILETPDFHPWDGEPWSVVGGFCV